MYVLIYSIRRYPLGDDLWVLTTGKRLPPCKSLDGVAHHRSPVQIKAIS